MKYMEDFKEPLVLVADSGSTKTDWCLLSDVKTIVRFSTQGINPFHQGEDTIRDIVGKELHTAIDGAVGLLSQVSSIRFYGAGCRGETADSLRSILLEAFPGCSDVFVESDLMAAAHAVCGTEEGIACILGTGANSCLYDGVKIVRNVSPLGYILGDEGSGAVLGKLFINALFKGDMPENLRAEFIELSGITLDDIIRRVYREPMANRWLASLSPFIHSHLDSRQVNDLVVANFVDFFKKNVDHYSRKDLPVGAVGSVAYYYKEQLEEAAMRCGYRLGRIVKNPMDILMNG